MRGPALRRRHLQRVSVQRHRPGGLPDAAQGQVLLARLREPGVVDAHRIRRRRVAQVRHLLRQRHAARAGQPPSRPPALAG